MMPTNRSAYAIIAMYLLVMGFVFTLMLFINRTAELVRIFFQGAILFLLIMPVVTMRLLAEERRSGTLELLLTSPVREIEIVAAKFVASLSVVLAMLALTAGHAVVLGIYAEPDWGPIYSGFLGLLLLAGALGAIGLLISGLTTNQIVAAVIALGVGILLWMIDSIGHLLPEPFDTIVTSMSLVAHFTPFATGALFLTDLGFFLSVILGCLFLTVRTLARR